MRFLVPAALSAFALVAPAFGADLEDRGYRYYYHYRPQQAQKADTVTVHDTVVSTAVQFVTVTVGADQAQCTQAVGALETDAPVPPQHQGQQTEVVVTTVTASPVVETVTSTRTHTTSVLHTTPVVVTETARDRKVYVHTVTKTITEQVRETELVTETKTKTRFVNVEQTRTVNVEVTQTEAPAIITTTATATATATAETATITTPPGGVIADVDNDPVTVTDVQTSTFLVTTTVDGVTSVETSTTIVTASDDIGGNIADVSTTETETETETETATATEAETETETETATATNTAIDAEETEDPQTSLTLSPRVIAEGLAQDGQATPNPGQVASLTSTNNFINFCLTQSVPLTDGQQIRSGSCNVVPMGFIIAKEKIPSAKFVFPLNFDKIPANQAFTAKLKIKNLQAGAFTNAQTNYYSAPAQVNDEGILIGHSHLVIEKINGLDDTEPCDPTKFTFFKGLNLPLDGEGTVSATLDNGVPPGTYRMFSINTAANHQPALASIAQHGSMDDGVYFTAE